MSTKKKIFAYLERIHPVIWQVLCLAVSIGIFSFILVNRSPNLLRPISMSLRTGFGVVIPITALAIYILFRVPGRLGELSSMAATMAIFALGLAGLWASGKTMSILINGLIPVSDATNYYIDATRILYGIGISNFTAMRPLFAGLFATFLQLSNWNLMAATGIFTALAGFACYLLCREIQKTHGAEIATFVLMLVFLYYRHHSGTSMSETLGVTVSLLGTALIWQGISKQREWIVLFGITLIALALNVRPGAMFVLPALLVWGGWYFRGQRRFSLKFFIIGAVLIGSMFFVNGLMIDQLAGSDAAAFENFSWAFYGLASGGKSWTYIFEAHPELRLLNNTEVTPAIYRLAFELILTQPSLIIKGALFYWQMFFSNTWYNAYAFVAGENYWVNEAARWGMYILCGLGIFKWFRDRKDPYASLALITALGVLASVPFVPPTDAYRVRLYAATIPFFILLPAIGLFLLREQMPLHFFQPENNPEIPGSYSTAVFSLVLVFVMIAAPILVKGSYAIPAIPEQNCPPEMDSIYVRFDEGTSVNVLRENIQFIDWMPDFHASIFRRNSHDLADINLTQVIETIVPPGTIFYALDFKSSQEVLVIIDTTLLPEPGTMLHACGTPDVRPEVSQYRIFYVESVVEGG